MGAVDQHANAALVKVRDDVLDRQDQGRGRGDVIDDGQLDPGGHRFEDARAHILGGGRQGNPRDADSRAGLAAAAFDRQPDGFVLMVGQEDLVTGRQVERLQHRLDAHRGVLDQRETVARRPDKRAQRIGHRAKRGWNVLGHDPRIEEIVRLGLHLAAKALLLLLNHQWAGPVGAVIEEDRVVGQRPKRPRRSPKFDVHLKAPRCASGVTLPTPTWPGGLRSSP